MLRFPYLDEPLVGPPPPSLAANARVRWRPLVPIVVHGLQGLVSFSRALVDCGADDSIFPLDVASLLNIPLQPLTGHVMRWRGQRYALRYGHIELELVDDDGNSLRWPALVGFSAANMRYPLLGLCGCLEFFDTRLLGNDHVIELEANLSFPQNVGP
jgi:hypothetical protein